MYNLAKVKHQVTYPTKQKFLEEVEQVHHSLTSLHSCITNLKEIVSSEMHKQKRGRIMLMFSGKYSYQIIH